MSYAKNILPIMLLATITYKSVFGADRNSPAIGTNIVERPISLAEAIRAALEKNLELKIDRLGPEKAKYNLDAAYAGYEPTLDFSGTRSFTSSPGGIDAQNRPFSGTTSHSDSFTAGLGARLPSGWPLG